MKVQAASAYLARLLGGVPSHHRHRALRLILAVERWWGSGGLVLLLRGEREAYVTVQRVDWKLSPRRTPNEREAEVLGFVSGKKGPYAAHGKYRPHLLFVRGKKRRTDGTRSKQAG